MVNTNRNLISYNRPGEPTGRHRDVTIVANNGTRNLDDLLASLEGCNANVRFDETRDDFNVMQVRQFFLFFFLFPFFSVFLFSSVLSCSSLHFVHPAEMRVQVRWQWQRRVAGVVAVGRGRREGPNVHKPTRQ